MNTKPLITSYYRAWLDGDRALARSLLADDMTFRSPEDNFESADSFIEACWKYSDHFDRMDILHEVYDEESGYLVYSMGDFCAGELVKVRDGKICAIYVTFEPTR